MTVGGGLRWWSQRLVLGVFGRLPRRLRRRIVRLLHPTYGAGSMVAISDGAGRVLLVRQTYHEGWTLPGGFLSAGESPQEAAVREVREEIGLAVELSGDGRLVMDLAPRRFDFVYPARLVGPVPDEVRSTSPEVAAVAWFGRAALPALTAEAATALAALDGDLGAGVPVVVRECPGR